MVKKRQETFRNYLKKFILFILFLLLALNITIPTNTFVLLMKAIKN